MTATYRLQLHAGFDFDDAAALVPYLKRLGVSHLYLSPVTEARPGSAHGYDVIDHNAVNPELGGRAGFDRLLETARAAGLGLLLDFVPNHAGVGPHNAAWQEVLAYGPHAAHAATFDIDYTPLKPELQGKVLLPFLGKPYGEALDAGEITVTFEDGRFYAAYYDHRFALAPRTYAPLLEPLLERHERTEAYFDLNDLTEAYRTLRTEERDKAEALHTRLTALAGQVDVASVKEKIQGDALHALLERQYWRLAYWKTAGSEINYRRFFNINGLVALRMEDESVFWSAHRLLGELLALEGVDGVRIDHVDGLYDPHRYLERLREAGARRIWVEKILAPGEILPEAWPIEGTTGYEFMNDVMGVLLHPDGEEPLRRAYRRTVPEARPYEAVVRAGKKRVMDTTLTSEIARLAYGLDRLSEADYHTRDFTLEALRAALEEVVAAFDRYRTYLPYDAEGARAVVQEAVHRARQHRRGAEPSVFAFIARFLLGEGISDDLDAARRAWVGRFQQYTAPVAAKGVEDTAFYRYVPLAALCEVGGEPEPFGTSAHAFHARARFRAHRYPRALLATATHDHKRGEDTRMRLIALAEAPDRWADTVQALEALGEAHRDGDAPAPNDRYLFYQILAGQWLDAAGAPADREALTDRLTGYMQKAAREAKQRTSWNAPDDRYEEALDAFVRGVLADEETHAAVGNLAALLARSGFLNSLSQLVLKAATPGVPDVYQGCELADLSLVDPDNRRPVDYDRRRALLDALAPLLEQPDAGALRRMIGEQDERAKLYITARLLRLRRAHEALFLEGDYQALEVEGTGADGWLAFARAHEDDALVVAVRRFPGSGADDREATLRLPDALAGHTWTDALSGQTLTPGATLETTVLPLPWAVLVNARAYHTAILEP